MAFRKRPPRPRRSSTQRALIQTSGEVLPGSSSIGFVVRLQLLIVHQNISRNYLQNRSIAASDGASLVSVEVQNIHEQPPCCFDLELWF
jgi:hypothetical protein